MTFTDVAKRAEKLIADNSPLILTAVGVTGTITTAYLTGKATFKAAEILREDALLGQREFGPDRVRDTREKFQLVWKEYIPAVGTGTVTVACIIAANQIGTRRAAAMAAAYSVSERAFTEYKEKVVEKIGENRERAVRDDIAQDRVRQNPVGDREVIIAGSGEVLCHEALTGRYFKSSMEELKSAQNAVNYQINNNFYASLTDFYNRIGLAPTAYSDEVGWNSDKLLELEFSTTLADDGRPCLVINYRVEPIREYFRLR